MPLPQEGLVLTDRLAAKRGVRVGDPLQAELLVGEPRTITLPVAATVREMMGLKAARGPCAPRPRSRSVPGARATSSAGMVEGSSARSVAAMGSS